MSKTCAKREKCGEEKWDANVYSPNINNTHWNRAKIRAEASVCMWRSTKKKKNMLLLWGNQLVQPQQISRVLCVSALKFVPSIKAYAFQNICSLLLCGKQIWFSVIGCQSKKKKKHPHGFFFFGATFKMSFCSFDEMKVSAKCHKCKGKLLLF